VSEVDTNRAGIAPELPGVVLTVGIIFSAVIGIIRTGMPEFAIPFAAPTFVTAALVLTASWVRGGRTARWWVPLIGLGVLIVLTFMIALLPREQTRGSYVWLMPVMILVFIGVTVIYWLIGLRNMSTGRGTGATVVFWLLVIAAPVWTAILLTLAVLDTSYEDVLTIPLLLSTSLGALAAVLGAGLAAASSRAFMLTGAVLLSLCAVIALVDLVTGSDAATKGALLVGAAAAGALAWRRARAAGPSAHA